MKHEVYTCDQCGALHEFEVPETSNISCTIMGVDIMIICGCGNQIEMTILFE